MSGCASRALQGSVMPVSGMPVSVVWIVAANAFNRATPAMSCTVCYGRPLGRYSLSGMAGVDAA